MTGMNRTGFKTKYSGTVEEKLSGAEKEFSTVGNRTTIEGVTYDRGGKSTNQ